MALNRIVMSLARNPDAGLAGGDAEHGYTLVAPLTVDGFLDDAAWREAPESCQVRAFERGQDTREGRLARRGANWYFDYDRGTSEDDEPVFKLARHKFVVGEYVTVTDDEGEPLVYRVSEVEAI